MEIVLFEPEIPPNTGNVARLCAATKTPLHLIRPLGFSLDDRYLKRAGLDYWPHVQVQVWENWDHYMLESGQGKRHVLSSARKGGNVHEYAFLRDDVLVMGPETRGLPPDMMNAHEHHVRIPIWGEVRSLNLSTATGILLYQALAVTGQLEGR